MYLKVLWVLWSKEWKKGVLYYRMQFSEWWNNKKERIYLVLGEIIASKKIME